MSNDLRSFVRARTVEGVSSIPIEDSHVLVTGPTCEDYMNVLSTLQRGMDSGQVALSTNEAALCILALTNAHELESFYESKDADGLASRICDMLGGWVSDEDRAGLYDLVIRIFTGVR